MINTDLTKLISDNTEAIIFDCDGTLADTMPLHYKAWHETFAAYSVSCTDEFLNSLAGVPTRQIVEKANETFSWSLPVDEFDKKKKKRSLELIIDAKAIKPVCDIAIHYHEKLPLAVASGGSRESVNLILNTINISQYFLEVITADDPVKPKPSPDIFLEASKRLNVNPQNCIVYEDGEPGIRAAIEAGMQVVDVRKYL